MWKSKLFIQNSKIMITEDRYYITKDTKLCSALRATNTGTFLQIDQERTTPAETYFVFTPLDECAKFAEKFYRGEVLVDPVTYSEAWQFFIRLIRETKMGGVR